MKLRNLTISDNQSTELAADGAHGEPSAQPAGAAGVLSVVDVCDLYLM